MNDLTLYQHQTSKPKTNRENELNVSTEAELLSISYHPGMNCLHAAWLRSISSAEFRQSVRMLARSIAYLRAELVLIDTSAMQAPSVEDLQWISSFLQEAFAKSSIRKSARVINSVDQESAMQTVINNTGLLPYKVAIFHDKQEAIQWLHDGTPNEHPAGEVNIHVPIDFNIKLLRQHVKQGTGNPKTATAESGTIANETTAPAALPNLLQLRTEYVAITIDPSVSLLSINWRKTPESRQYRYGMLKAGRALKERGLKRVLLNNQRLGVLTLEDQGWLISASLEVLPSTNIAKLAVVTSTDVWQQMSSEAIGCKLKAAKLPYKARYFLTEEEASEWLMLTEDAE